MYQKNMIYLYAYQGENRKQNVGFIKIERMEQQCILTVHVRGAGVPADGNYALHFIKEEEKQVREIAKFTLHRGFGDLKLLWKEQEKEAMSDWIDSFDVAQIQINDAWSLMGANRQKKGVVYSVQEAKEQEEKIEIQRNEVQKTDLDEIEEISELEVYEADKWSELRRTYQNVYPFGDERCFITMAPKDIPILCQAYQPLAQNSFLLHGYYNYRHLILGWDDAFYLGVPGTYHEREKMVALMFGFEAFESLEETPCTGTFGYYLRKVEL